MPVLLVMRLIIVVFFIISPNYLLADEVFLKEYLTETLQEELAWHPVWLKLLHFNVEANQSEIHSEEFFLSPQGPNNPKAELLATVEAYFAPWTENPNSHPRCQFPARFFWLSHYISFPDYTFRVPQCNRLEKWALFDEPKSISVLLVSGYLGNPASTFGHALLKLNNNAYDDPVDLLNLSINYGALVPQNEFIWSYIVRGLTGGYQASFSDKYFYSHDLVYSRTEFRDMWEYELALSDEECTLLILHLWEVVGKKFTYFFLKENCAFRLAELLELVIPEPLLDHTKFWYIPVEMFHRFIEIDTKRHQAGQQALIKSIRFIPSSQRKLYHQFGRLTTKEKKAVHTIIQEGPTSIPEQIEPFEPGRQLEVLDTVLTYHEYRLMAEEPSPNPERRAIKDQVLLAQLRLPPAVEMLPAVPMLNSPANGNRPMLISLGVGHSLREGTYFTLHWSPFSQESIGQNSLEGDELVVLDTMIGIGGEYDIIFVDQWDFIRIRKMKTTFMTIGDENPWSWQLRIGTMQTDQNDTSRYDGICSFGVGRVWKFHEAISLYAMTDISAHTLLPHARLRPHIGITVGNNLIRSRLYTGAESKDYEGNFNIIWGSQLQCQVSDQFAVFLDLSNSEGRTTKTSFELRWYW